MDSQSFRGYDRAKYDLSDPSSHRRMARDAALHDSAVQTVLRGMNCNCGGKCACDTKKAYVPNIQPRAGLTSVTVSQVALK